MLIAQNANRAPGAQEVHDRLKSFLAIKELQTVPAPNSPEMRINVTIAELLIDARVPNVSNEFRWYVREEFPSSKMTQNEHNWCARSKLLVHRSDIVDLDVLEDFIDRHARELDAAEEVCAESLKMTAHKMAQLA